MVGGWLLRNGGLIEGMQYGKRICIPDGGILDKRRADWLVGNRIVVEVKTYRHILGQGSRAKNTHQMVDYSLWRDARSQARAVVLASVSWGDKSQVDPLFVAALGHLKIPLVSFVLKMAQHQ